MPLSPALNHPAPSMTTTPANPRSAGDFIDPYLKSFDRWEQAKSPDAPSWVFPIRKAGIARFSELGLPTQRDEDWRYTSIAPLAKLPFEPILNGAHSAIEAGALASLTFGQLDTHRLVFVNGHFNTALSSIQSLPAGAKVVNLLAALKASPELAGKHFSRHAVSDHNPFVALNNAFFQDGAFLYVPAGQTLDKPVHLVFISTDSDHGNSLAPRNLIIAEKHSNLTVLESYVSTGQRAYFTNAVLEAVVGEGAVLEYCKFQDESPQAFHLAALHAHLGRACNFTAHSFATGSRLSRNQIAVKLDGERIDCILNGLYITKEDQLADHHMVVEHAQPHCNSHEYFNGILDDRSRGVFHGRILVQPEAQKTDAKQTNKNLLLSNDATANTKPQLEIYADDVKCTHGATIGQLSEESIFYLRARGIGLDTARRLLIHAFAGEIIARVRCAAAREELDQLIWDRLEKNPHVAQSH